MLVGPSSPWRAVFCICKPQASTTERASASAEGCKDRIGAPVTCRFRGCVTQWPCHFFASAAIVVKATFITMRRML